MRPLARRNLKIRMSHEQRGATQSGSRNYLKKERGLLFLAQSMFHGYAHVQHIRTHTETFKKKKSVRISRAAHEDLTKSATRYAENPHRGCVDKSCSLIFQYDCWREEPAHIRAIQSHTSQNLDIVTFLTVRLRKATRNFLSILVTLPTRIQSRQVELYQKGFGEETKKSACYFSLVHGLGQESGHEVQGVHLPEASS